MRATLGKRSGPTTIKATTAIRASFDTPRSIIDASLVLSLYVWFDQVLRLVHILGLHINGLIGLGRGLRLNLFGLGFFIRLHAIFETLYGTT